MIDGAPDDTVGELLTALGELEHPPTAAPLVGLVGSGVYFYFLQLRRRELLELLRRRALTRHYLVPARRRWVAPELHKVRPEDLDD